MTEKPRGNMDEEMNGIFNGRAKKIFFAPIDSVDFSEVDKIKVRETAELATIIADSVKITYEEEDSDDDLIRQSYTSGSYKKSIDAPSFDFTQLKTWLDRCSYPTYMFRITGLRKPKNLKYPRKKRKMRILKKWAKRFGYDELVIPKMEHMVKFKNGKIIHSFIELKKP